MTTSTAPFPTPRAGAAPTRTRSRRPVPRPLLGLQCALALLLARPRRRVGDAGMSTAEYAVGTVAAVAFAAVLYKVVQSGAVQSALSSIIQGALGITL